MMPKTGDSFCVEWVEHSHPSIPTGTGRYLRELYGPLAQIVPMRRARTVDPPLTAYLQPLHHFPMGIQGHQAGSVVHFTQPLGSALMLWNPAWPAVATVHDLSWLAWGPEIRMYRKVERLILHLSYLCLKRMDAILTVSEFTRSTVIDRLGIQAERVFAIHSGNRPDQFRPVAGASARLQAKYRWLEPAKFRYLLYVGNEYPRKNLDLLLQALSLLPGDVRLLKVGSAGGQRFRRRTLRRIERLGLEDRVISIGEVSEEELVLFYNAADVYVCGSFLEGFCHPILEAMACGTPVVCSNAASLPEVAGEAAILTSPEDAGAFAQAVRTVLDDGSKREQMIARGLQQAASFSWERTAREVADVYRQVAAA